jgi:hypothetical protein
MFYQIRIRGHLQNLLEWADGLSVTQEEEGITLLAGPIVDQAALYGLLRKINDLGMPLVSVAPIESGENGENQKVK